MDPLEETRRSSETNFLEVPSSNEFSVDEEEVESTLTPKFSPVPKRKCSTLDDLDAEGPATVTRKVSFADAFGLDLVSVKEFNTWDTPQIPATENSEDENVTVVDEGYFLTSSIIYPPCRSDLMQELYRKKVVLESLEFLPGSVSVKGIIRVLNVSYHKLVYVRMTLDAWKNYYDLPAEYIPESHDGETDQFFFKISFVPPYLNDGASAVFCIRYESSVGTFWENNGGENFVILCHKKDSQQAVQIDEDSQDEAIDKSIKSCLKTAISGKEDAEMVSEEEIDNLKTSELLVPELSAEDTDKIQKNPYGAKKQLYEDTTEHLKLLISQYLESVRVRSTDEDNEQNDENFNFQIQNEVTDNEMAQKDALCTAESPVQYDSAVALNSEQNLSENFVDNQTHLITDTAKGNIESYDVPRNENVNLPQNALPERDNENALIARNVEEGQRNNTSAVDITDNIYCETLVTEQMMDISKVISDAVKGEEEIAAAVFFTGDGGDYRQNLGTNVTLVTERIIDRNQDLNQMQHEVVECQEDNASAVYLIDNEVCCETETPLTLHVSEEVADINEVCCETETPLTFHVSDEVADINEVCCETETPLTLHVSEEVADINEIAIALDKVQGEITAEDSIAESCQNDWAQSPLVTEDTRDRKITPDIFEIQEVGTGDKLKTDGNEFCKCKETAITVINEETADMNKIIEVINKSQGENEATPNVADDGDVHCKGESSKVGLVSEAVTDIRRVAYNVDEGQRDKVSVMYKADNGAYYESEMTKTQWITEVASDISEPATDMNENNINGGHKEEEEEEEKAVSVVWENEGTKPPLINEEATQITTITHDTIKGHEEKENVYMTDNDLYCENGMKKATLITEKEMGMCKEDHESVAQQHHHADIIWGASCKSIVEQQSLQTNFKATEPITEEVKNHMEEPVPVLEHSDLQNTLNRNTEMGQDTDNQSIPAMDMYIVRKDTLVDETKMELSHTSRDPDTTVMKDANISNVPCYLVYEKTAEAFVSTPLQERITESTDFSHMKVAGDLVSISSAQGSSGFLNDMQDEQLHLSSVSKTSQESALTETQILVENDECPTHGTMQVQGILLDSKDFTSVTSSEDLNVSNSIPNINENLYEKRENQTSDDVLKKDQGSYLLESLEMQQGGVPEKVSDHQSYTEFGSTTLTDGRSRSVAERDITDIIQTSEKEQPYTCGSTEANEGQMRVCVTKDERSITFQKENDFRELEPELRLEPEATKDIHVNEDSVLHELCDTIESSAHAAKDHIENVSVLKEIEDVCYEENAFLRSTAPDDQRENLVSEVELPESLDSMFREVSKTERCTEEDSRETSLRKDHTDTDVSCFSDNSQITEICSFDGTSSAELSNVSDKSLPEENYEVTLSFGALLNDKSAPDILESHAIKHSLSVLENVEEPWTCDEPALHLKQMSGISGDEMDMFSKDPHQVPENTNLAALSETRNTEMEGLPATVSSEDIKDVYRYQKKLGPVVLVSESVGEDDETCAISAEISNRQSTSEMSIAESNDFTVKECKSFSEGLMRKDTKHLVLIFLMFIIFIATASHYDFTACVILYLVSLIFLYWEGGQRK
ncbi:uncharacterized protein LOC122804038 [Protopterus annectens]|uniref:uncharacterized protein LOC122804038 n=1 Tax=Protopterus annectens TaxID=7888 RepID=UPI001CFAD6D9|nr:uncharacterized protein LOC122804038 [Protopterus annectens]